MTTVQLSERVQRVKPSATIAVSTLAREMRAAGRDVLSLSAGEPDFDTPEHVCAAAVQAMESGDTRYTAADGTPALKQAICNKFERDNGLSLRARPDQRGRRRQAGPLQRLRGGAESRRRGHRAGALLGVLPRHRQALRRRSRWSYRPDWEAGYKVTPEQVEEAITESARG